MQEVLVFSRRLILGFCCGAHEFVRLSSLVGSKQVITMVTFEFIIVF